MIVADTNLVAYLLIEGDRTEAARGVRLRDPVWRVPPLWRSELLSVLATSVRADVLDEADARRAWAAAKALLARCEEEPGGEEVLSTALRRGLSAYDAQFVVLAERRHVTLVTGDRRVLERCPDIAVSIEGFAQSTSG